MRQIRVEYARPALQGVGWWYNGTVEAIILFPSGNTSLGDIEELADIFGCVPMRDEPEGAMLQLLADVAENHEVGSLPNV